MFGLPSLSMLSVADGTGSRPNNSPEDMTALQKLYAAAAARNHTPQGRIDRGFAQFPHMGAAPAPMLPTPPTPAPVDMGSPQAPPPPALSAQALAPVPPVASAPTPVTIPTPQPRPPEAPQAPDMSFWQRNAAMMQDPMSGAFIDPSRAETAQASGPDVINKLLSYFHQKANKDNA